MAASALILNVALAALGLAACLAAAPWLARFFHIEQHGALAVAFAPLWIRAWTNVPVARLRKALAFGRAAVVQAAPSVAYPAVSIPLALAGFGPWALVLGQAAASLAGAAAAWLLVEWRPRLGDFDWQTGRTLATYGRPILGSNLLGTLNDQVDNWVVGRLFGPAALGLYTMAFRLATLPRTGFTFVVSEVLLPAIALVQGDERRLRALFLRSLHWVSVFSIPASVGLALLARDLIAVVLGPRWAGAVTAVRILTGFGLCAALSAATGDVFKATGRSHLILRVGLVHSLALWIGLAWLARLGLPYAALAVTGAAAVSSLVAFAAAVHVLGLGPGAIVRSLVAPTMASAVMGAVLAGLPGDAGAAGALAVRVLAGATAYVAALAVFAPGDVRELRLLVAALRPARRGSQASTALGLTGTGSARTSRDPC